MFKKYYSKVSLLFNYGYRKTLYPLLKKFEQLFVAYTIQKLPLFFPQLNTIKTFGIPKSVIDLSNFPVKEIYPKKIVHRTLPKSIYPSHLPDFVSETHLPTAHTLALPNGIVTDKGAVLTANGELIKELTIQYGLDNILKHKLFRLRFKKLWTPCKHFSNRVAWLTMDKQGNIAHWLYDVLPRLDLYKNSEHPIEKIYAKLDHDYQLESLKLAGFKDHQIIDANIHPIISADTMLVGSTPCTPGVASAWICQFLKNCYLNEISRYLKSHTLPKRIYISRSDNGKRHIKNEDLLTKLLKKYHFEIIRPEHISFLKSISYFANAEVILSPHGAALSRLVFSKPTTTCIEILPNQNLNPFYWHLCEENGLDYYYMLAEPTDLNAGKLAKYHKSCLSIDLDELEATFKLAKLSY